MQEPVKLHIIDDHQVLVDSLILFFEMKGIVVTGVAADIDAARELISGMHADIALLDINLSGADGGTLIPFCLQHDTKPIMLSSYADVRIAKKCFKDGACGYITKDSPSAAVMTAIDTVMKGDKYIDPTLKEKMIAQQLNGHSQEFLSKERHIKAHLSKRELEVVRLIALEMTSEEIAKELFIAKSTVDTYRKSLIEKLHVKNSVGLGVWAVENGVV